MYKYILIFFSVILYSGRSVQAQPYNVPKGPVYDAMVKAYVSALQTGKLEEMKTKLPAMEKAYPGHPYTIYFQSFYKQASGEDEAAAMKGYTEAIRLMPEFSDPFIRRAGLLADKGLYERAIADMDKAILAEGKDAYAALYSDRADYKVKAGDVKAALQDFKQAVQLSPADAGYWRAVGKTSIEAGETSAVAAMFLNALNTSQKENAAVRIAYADFLLQQQKWNEAYTQYTQALAQKEYIPGSTDFNSAGIAAYKLKNYTQAATLLEKGIALDPSNADMICNRANVDIDLKNWEAVYSWATKALAADNKSALANMMMAVAIKRTGRGDALAAEYEAKAKKIEAGQ